MRYSLIFGLVLIKSNWSVNSEKYKAGDDDDSETPVEIDRVSPVNGDPAQKEKDDNVVDKLDHVNIVELAKPDTLESYFFYMVLSLRCVFNAHPLFIVLLVHSRVLRRLLRESYRDYIFWR